MSLTYIPYLLYRDRVEIQIYAQFLMKDNDSVLSVLRV